jgi:hypothetical protein
MAANIEEKVIEKLRVLTTVAASRTVSQRGEETGRQIRAARHSRVLL